MPDKYTYVNNIRLNRAFSVTLFEIFVNKNDKTFTLLSCRCKKKRLNFDSATVFVFKIEKIYGKKDEI